MTDHNDLRARSPQQALQMAVRSHQAGDLKEAEQLYRRVLEDIPDQADALNLLGVIAQQHGDLDKALALFDQAIAAAPNLATIPFNKANALKEAGRNDEAIALYKTALDIEPDYADARLNLGALLHDRGDTQAAVAQFNLLLKGAPDHARAYYNLGKCRQTQGRLEDAQTALAKAIELDPNDPDAHFAQANVLADMGRLHDAIKHIDNAIKIKPGWALAVSSRGLILGRSGDSQKSFESCLSAISTEPDNILLHFNLASLHYHAGDSETAKHVLLQALERCDTTENEILNLAVLVLRVMNPWIAIAVLNVTLTHMRSANVLHCLGVSFDSIDLTAVALTFYNDAIDLDPTKASIYESRGKLRVSQGHLEDGWSDLKHAQDIKEATSSAVADLPTWAGESLKAKTILLTLEEGIGDQILFSTLIGDLTKKADLCIVECAKRLVPVLQRSFPDVKVTDWLDPMARAKNRSLANYISPAVNTARYLRQSVSSFPRAIPPLKTDTTVATEFRRKYETIADGRKIVGLSWLSGSLKNGAHKTLDLEALIRRFEPNSVLFVSLQYGPVTEQIEGVALKTGVTIYEDESVNQLYNIDQFFAQVAAMDLVISISNTAAHISGSIGVPTWLLLPRGTGAFYFWFLDRTDSPWYPSVRIFRQRSILDEENPWWTEVLDEVSEALNAWMKEPLSRRLIP